MDVLVMQFCCSCVKPAPPRTDGTGRAGRRRIKRSAVFTGHPVKFWLNRLFLLMRLNCKRLFLEENFGGFEVDFKDEDASHRRAAASSGAVTVGTGVLTLSPSRKRRPGMCSCVLQLTEILNPYADREVV